MKKLFLVLVSTFLLVACASESPTNNLPQLSEEQQKEGKIVEINLFDITQMFSNGEEFIVLFTQDYCGYCQDFKEMYHYYASNHNLNIYEVNLTNEERSESENVDIIRYYWPAFNGTPAIYYCNDGEIVSTFSDGNSGMNLQLLEEWVNENNLLCLPLKEVSYEE